MKLTELHEKELKWNDDETVCLFEVDDSEICITFEQLDEMVKVDIGRNSKDSTSKAMSGLGKWAKELVTNPYVLAVTAASAAKAIGKWKKQKKDEMYFTAKSVNEKKFYEKMVQDLVGSGKYKIVKHTQLGAATYEWLLRKI